MIMGQDITDMGQSSTEFRFTNANDKSNPVRDGNVIGLPVTTKTDDDQITMFMDHKNNFHKPRHRRQQGVRAFQKTIININLINPALLKVMVDQPGINQQYIYRNNPIE